MTSYMKYLNFASKSFTEIYPKTLRVDSFKSDMDGRAIDEEGDWLRNSFTTTETVVNTKKELYKFLEDTANPSVFSRVYEI